MTSKTAGYTDEGNWPSSCWCCGAAKAEAQLVRLGARPEAAVCIDCVPSLRQRARAHETSPTVARHLHRAADRIRGVVMTAGLNRKPVLGRVVRWINRRSPF